jgi:hypothetical protein
LTCYWNEAIRATDIEYDFSTGELVDSVGHRTSFVLFLADYLSAARLLWYLFSVCEKLTLEILDVPSDHREVAMRKLRRNHR